MQGWAMSNMIAVVTTILEQMGGNKFIAMTGARDFVAAENSLGFKFRGSQTYNYLEVRLTPEDLYDLRFCRLGRLGQVEEEEKIAGVFFDQLQPIFTACTGLDTHL